MKLYGGIDLHSNNSVLVLIDEEDRVVVEKRLRNDLALMLGPSSRAIASALQVWWWSRPITGTGWSMG